MITGHVCIATSLDGFIARPDGSIGWLLERDDGTEIITMTISSARWIAP